MVLKALEKKPILGVEIVTKFCFGQCGNGPMVVVLPEETWYSRVHLDHLNLIVQQHSR